MFVIFFPFHVLKKKVISYPANFQVTPFASHFHKLQTSEKNSFGWIELLQIYSGDITWYQS